MNNIVKGFALVACATAVSVSAHAETQIGDTKVLTLVRQGAAVPASMCNITVPDEDAPLSFVNVDGDKVLAFSNTDAPLQISFEVSGVDTFKITSPGTVSQTDSEGAEEMSNIKKVAITAEHKAGSSDDWLNADNVKPLVTDMDALYVVSSEGGFAGTYPMEISEVNFTMFDDYEDTDNKETRTSLNFHCYGE